MTQPQGSKPTWIFLGDVLFITPLNVAGLLAEIETKDAHNK